MTAQAVAEQSSPFVRMQSANIFAFLHFDENFRFKYQFVSKLIADYVMNR